jgi:hypothetical protein
MKMKLKNKAKLLAMAIVVSALLASFMTLTSALPAANVSKRPINTDAVVSTVLPAEVERLKQELPNTLADVEAKMLPLRGRFLMWTHDLQHIMWGRFGANHFVGVDNLGKTAWGIYGRGYFAGFYDGQFFWGKYGGQRWYAENLFGMRSAYGKYVTYPVLPTTASNVP